LIICGKLRNFSTAIVNKNASNDETLTVENDLNYPKKEQNDSSNLKMEILSPGSSSDLIILHYTQYHELHYILLHSWTFLLLRL
jgi:hypothetical protein